jgi:hypothetical protein
MDLIRDLREGFFQSTLDEGNREMSYVDANPLARKLLCRMDCGPAPAERI